LTYRVRIETTVDTEQRLCKLDRENRPLTLGVVVLAATLVAAALFAYVRSPIAEAQTIPERIVAREFVLVDPQGETVGALSSDTEGQPSLMLMEASSPESLGNRAIQVMLYTVSDRLGGGGILAVGSAREQGGILLRTYQDGREPFIQVYNPRGRAVWSAPSLMSRQTGLRRVRHPLRIGWTPLGWALGRLRDIPGAASETRRHPAERAPTTAAWTARVDPNDLIVSRRAGRYGPGL
jgi:hypothetical protein